MIKIIVKIKLYNWFNQNDSFLISFNCNFFWNHSILVHTMQFVSGLTAYLRSLYKASRILSHAIIISLDNWLIILDLFVILFEIWAKRQANQRKKTNLKIFLKKIICQKTYVYCYMGCFGAGQNLQSLFLVGCSRYTSATWHGDSR